MTKECGIIFSDEEVRALLDGRKSQLRRVVKLDEFHRSGMDWAFRDKRGRWHDCNTDSLLDKCPFGTVGQRLWVREAWFPLDGDCTEGCPRFLYRGTYGEGGTWKPSIHMPRWASRITLEITGVRVERVQDIRPCEVQAEGCPYTYSGFDPDDAPDWTGWYRDLWDSIHAKRPGQSWSDSPWVWVIEFRRMDP